MAGEKVVQKNLLEILLGAKDVREKNALSSTDEGVLLSHDGGPDSALEARETLDAGEGLAALNPGQKVTFSARGGPILGHRDGTRTEAFIGGVARVVTSRPFLILAAAFVAMVLATQAIPTPINFDISNFLGITHGPVACVPSGNSSILSFFSALVCH